jgi:hypothetical protein
MMQYGDLIGLVRTACAVSAMALLASSVSAQGVEKSLRATTTPPSLASLKATARSAAALNPNLLGSFSSDLVYTAVTPCRIVDTRNAVGAFSGGQTRTYDLDGLGGAATTYAQQGGVAASCNIPYGKATAAALNLTVTGTTSPGYLAAWGLGTQPNASVLNWATGDTLANTTIVPIVPSSGNDFSIYSSSGAHVIIDVVGYYAAPTAIQIAAPIRMGSETGTLDSPSFYGGSSNETAYAGMVTRRIFSGELAAGSVVARSPDMTLERNGSYGGFQIRVGANAVSQAYKLAVHGTVLRSTGVISYVNYEVTAPPTTGVLTQLIADADSVVHAHLTFGNFYSGGNITEVTISRQLGDYYWLGSLISSFNQ